MSFEQWTRITLGDVFEVKHGFAFKGEFFSEKTTNSILLTPGNFQIGGGFKDDKLKFYDGPIPEDYILDAGEIIVTMTDLSRDGDTLGYSAIVPKLDNLIFLHNQRIGLLQFKEVENVNRQFIYWLLRTREYQNFIVNSATGSTVKHTSPTRIQEYEFDLPSLQEQRRIADILSALDDKIELNRQTNATLEAMAQAIFKEWFVDFNYPGATGELVDSELGLIPAGWRVGKLGEIYRTTSGGTPSRTNPEFYLNGTIHWIKSKEINGSFIIDTEEKITEEALKRSSAKLLPPYSVVIAMYGATVGEYGVVAIEATCNQAICAFLPNQQYPFTFIFHILKNNKDEIISRSVGSAQQNISQDTLKRFEVVLPSTNLIQAFHEITHPLFQSIENNIRESSSLEQIRNELLPKLMTGDIVV